MACNGLSGILNQIVVVHIIWESQKSPTEMVLWAFDSLEQRPVSPHDCTQNIGTSSKCSLQKTCSLNVVEWMQVAGRSTWSGHRSTNHQGQHANPRVSLWHTTHSHRDTSFCCPTISAAVLAVCVFYTCFPKMFVRTSRRKLGMGLRSKNWYIPVQPNDSLSSKGGNEIYHQIFLTNKNIFHENSVSHHEWLCSTETASAIPSFRWRATVCLVESWIKSWLSK